MDALHGLWERYRDRIDFAVVYIREAHPEDGWVVNMNRDQDIRINDPTTDAERHEVAATCAVHLKIRIPVVIDGIGDEIASAYGALPTRLYLVGRGGKVTFQGDPGPFGLKPGALEEAIQSELKRIA